MRTPAAVFLIFLLAGLNSYSQNTSIEAIRISQAPKIDGSLDDAAWINAPIASGFIQSSPNVGAPANQKTEIRIVYDDNAIYIGAYLYDDPAEIRKQFTARDDEGQKDVDYFSVFFDTYHDRQNGFQFLVTSANVQSDAKLDPNARTEFGSYGDKTWEAVWSSEVSMKNDGWVVEMRIPYLSLRFPKADVQSWGLQFLRFVRRNNESSFWKEVKPEINGFINQFGDFNNLKNIKPPLRLSFSPYVSTGVRSSPEENGFNKTWLRNGGMDIKYGVNESFTLDATLIPDFGQVVSDNVINNLTPYEQKFTENRPFFTEGTELFNKAGLFYSRRIGRIPTKYFSVRAMGTDPNIEVEKNPTVTELINAIKFSGRNENRLGIGIFNAVGAPMHAIIRNKTTGEKTKIETEPLTNYNIFVLDQALKGRSYLTFTNTNVIRNGTARDANVSAFDFALYNKNNSHLLQGTARYSKIWSSTNPYDGYNTMVRYSKVSGRWRYALYNNIESGKYDPNDLGFIPAANEINSSATLSYNQFTPTEKFISYNYGITVRYNMNYDPRSYAAFRIDTKAFWYFKNFWDISFNTVLNPVAYKDFFELQTPGKFIRYQDNYQFSVSGSSDSRKKMFVNYGADYAVTPEFDNHYYRWVLGARYRFSNKFSLGAETEKSFEDNNRGYAFLREMNGDPIAGQRDVTNFTSLLTSTFNFTSRQNLTLRVRHYWSKVIYNKFYTIDADGDFVNRPDPVPPGGNDENFNLFNVDAFFTWDFRLGSRLIVGYKNWLGENEQIDGTTNQKYFNNLSEIFNVRHGNELTVRFIYFLDYNQLHKKH